MQRCAVDGTVVATVASQADLSALEALSRSAVQAGFPCVVVQPAAPLEAALDADQALKTALGDVRVFALPFVSTKLEAPVGCTSAEHSAHRRTELHRAWLWQEVLDQHLDLLAIDVRLTLVSSPLPHLLSLATSEWHRVSLHAEYATRLPDVVGTPDGWQLRHDLLWVRSTPSTRALMARTAHRVLGSDLSFVWNEELSYDPELRNISCCHTHCVRIFLNHGGTANEHQPSRTDCLRDRRQEWSPIPSNHTAFKRPWARCTKPSNHCFRRAITERTTPVPAPGTRLQHHYAANRMYGADDTFRSPCFSFLRGIAPTVLQLEGSAHRTGGNLLGADLGVAPQPVISSKEGGMWPVRFFNPSIVAAPPGLCPRCAFVLTLRADCTHQCDQSSLYSTRGRGEKIGRTRLFRGTAVVVLDSAMRRLGWTWMINAPRNQVANRKLAAKAAADRKSFAVPGDADGFNPVYVSPVFDVRLFSYRGHLFATAVVPVGFDEPLCVIHVQVTATPTADGGLTQLRVWASRRISSQTPWALGRNQAFFSSADGNLLLQPWIGKIGSYGRLEFHRSRYACHPNVSMARWRKTQKKGSFRASAARGALPALVHPRLIGANVGMNSDLANAPRGPAGPRISLGTFTECGTHATGTLLEIDEVASLERGSRRMEWQRGNVQVDLDLVTNQSLGFLRDGLGGKRLSATSHLVAVQGVDPGGHPCSVLLGVGHLHRYDGHQNHKACRAFSPKGWCRKKALQPLAGINGHHVQQEFQFGYFYTHFFYTVQSAAPHRMTATTGEFCIGSAQDASDCESAQFVSGMVVDAPGEKLLLTFGVNDCEAKFGTVPLRQVGRMLSALPGEAVCRPGGGA
jgi:hypothetical protein